jgi:glycosyltransferase involved in cell wall biosynthesis
MTGRVLHVIPSVSMVHGGPSVAMRAMEQALSRTGWSSDTATTDDDGRGRRLARPLNERVVDGQGSRWYFKKSIEFYKVSWPLLSWLLREVRHYDVVHVHGLFSFTSVVAAWVARQQRIPYVIRPLGVLTRYGVTRRRPFLKRLSLRFIEGPLLRNAAVVHFTTETERNEALLLNIPLSSVVIPLGIEVVTRGSKQELTGTAPVSDAPLHLLYLSRLDPKKNVEGLLRALGSLRRAGLRPTLSMAGTGEVAYVGRLQALARAEELEPQVRWLGQVSGDTKAELLAMADVFVMPSFSENFGIAVVEAMAAGLPCVVGQGVGLSGAVVQAGAGVAVDTDAESIAAGLRRYLESADLRARAGEAARRLARTAYSCETMGGRLVALYESIRRRG